jgi:hypothetical protein
MLDPAMVNTNSRSPLLDIMLSIICSVGINQEDQRNNKHDALHIQKIVWKCTFYQQEKFICCCYLQVTKEKSQTERMNGNNFFQESNVCALESAV